jgi:hypothetical protein
VRCFVEQKRLVRCLAGVQITQVNKKFLNLNLAWPGADAVLLLPSVRSPQFAACIFDLPA